MTCVVFSFTSGRRILFNTDSMQLRLIEPSAVETDIGAVYYSSNPIDFANRHAS